MSSILLSLASQIEDLEFKITRDGFESIYPVQAQLINIKSELEQISTKKLCEVKYQKYVESKHFAYNELVAKYSMFIDKCNNLKQEISNCGIIPQNILKYINKQNNEHIDWYKRMMANSANELNNIESFDEYINKLYGTLMTKQLKLQHELEEKLEILEEINSEQFQILKNHLQI